MLGGSEMLIVGGAIVAVCFGPKILKSWGKGAAESIREFRNIKKELAEPIEAPYIGIDPGKQKGK